MVEAGERLPAALDGHQDRPPLSRLGTGEKSPQPLEMSVQFARSLRIRLHAFWRTCSVNLALDDVARAADVSRSEVVVVHVELRQRALRLAQRDHLGRARSSPPQNGMRWNLP